MVSCYRRLVQVADSASMSVPWWMELWGAEKDVVLPQDWVSVSLVEVMRLYQVADSAPMSASVSVPWSMAL